MSLEGSLTGLLTRAARLTAVRVEEILKADGLSLDQWLVVEALVTEGALTMAEIAARTMITGPTLTRVVDRLVTTAAVYREVDLADRRRVRVHLAPRGRSAHRRLAPKVEMAERQLLDRVGDAAATVTGLRALADPGE